MAAPTRRSSVRPPARRGVEPDPVRRRARQPNQRPQAASPSARPAACLLLLLCVGALIVIGLVMVLSASSVQALRSHGSSWYFFNRQLIWVAIGTVAMLAAAEIDYRFWRRLALPVLGVSVALMGVVLIPSVGIEVSGSSRWLGLGPLRLQPSELAKLGLVLFGADLLARRSHRVAEWSETLRPLVGIYLVMAVLLIAQPDLGTTLVCGCIVVALLFLAGTPLPGIGGLVVGAGFGTLLLARVEPYRWQRMTSFMDPFADAANTGYQAAQGRIALASGGLSGVGLGASRAKWGFLPAAHTDFIFAIIGEELGLAGALVVVALYAGLTCLCVRTAMRAPDRFGLLLAGGVTAWLVGQAAINMGAVVGLLPITGVPLPFVSSGGSSLVPMMAAMGIVLNITRHARRPGAARRRPATVPASSDGS